MIHLHRGKEGECSKPKTLKPEYSFTVGKNTTSRNIRGVEEDRTINKKNKT